MTRSPPTDPPATTTLLARAITLVEDAASVEITLRLCGGLGIAYHCRSSPHLQRATCSDIDLVSRLRQRPAISDFMRARGFEEDRRLASAPELRRSAYRSHDPAIKVDVNFDTLRFAHTLDIESRIAVCSPTIPRTELLMQKLQIVAITEKDVWDVFSLLAVSTLSNGSDVGIDPGRLAEACARNWGLWRTVVSNLDRLPALFRDRFPGPSLDGALDALSQIRGSVNATPKTMRWRLRRIIGERVRWYEIPEDVAVPAEGGGQ